MLAKPIETKTNIESKTKTETKTNIFNTKLTKTEMKS